MKRAAPEEPPADLDAGPLFREPLVLTPRSIDANVSLSPEMADAIRSGMFPGLSVREAERRRDDGIDSAATSLHVRDPEWEARFNRTLYEMALTTEFLLSEDVLEKCPPPARVNAKSTGGLMRTAADKGWIVAAGYAKARTSNMSMKTRWRSLLIGRVNS